MLKRVGARFICTLFVALIWLGTSALAADRTTEDSIRAFIEGVNAASLRLFSSDSEAEARGRARALLARAFDVPAMAKEALGAAWDTATEEERGELLAAFEDDVIGAYLRRMRPEGTNLTFIGHRPPSDGNHFAASRRSVPGKKDQIWIWSLRPDGESWRITDLLLGGHSAVYTARHEYASVLESNNGNLNALIAFMRKRAAE